MMTTLKHRVVTTGLQIAFAYIKSNLNFPWEILWGKDDHIWVTERNGKISKIEPKSGNTVF
jgi:hypothetical protein